MQYTFSSDRPSDLKEEVVICFVPEMKAVAGPFLKSLDEASGKLLSQAVTSQEFTGKGGEFLSFTNPKGWKTRRLIMAGLGDAKKVRRRPVPPRHGRTLASEGGVAGARSRPLFWRQD